MELIIFAGLEQLLREAGARRGKAICILNFPNNPTGYSLTLKEADNLVSMLISVAQDGTDILVITDDAYFGLQYEPNLLTESIFARLADAHPNILAVKADGPTKEDYVWSFRLGFVSFASKGLGAKEYDALEKKMLGVVRSSVSSSNGAGQQILLKALDSQATETKKPSIDPFCRRVTTLLRSIWVRLSCRRRLGHYLSILDTL